MRKAVLTLLLSGLVLICNAQNQDDLVNRIIEASSRITSLSCNFIQIRNVSIMTESISSEGNMSYESPDVLRWEYVSPSHIVLEIDGDNVSIEVDGKAMPADSQSGRIYKGISKFMMGSISGSMLRDEKRFVTTVTEEDGHIIAELIPKKGDMKAMFAKITMLFRTSDYTASSISLIETTGDTINITFENTKITTTNETVR